MVFLRGFHQLAQGVANFPDRSFEILGQYPHRDSKIVAVFFFLGRRMESLMHLKLTFVACPDSRSEM